MTITRRAFQTGLLLAASGLRPAIAETAGIAGTWSGLLEAGSHRLRLELEIAADNTAKLISLDQGQRPHPGKVNAPTAERVEIDFATIHAAFSGRFIAPDRLEGEWRQGAEPIPLTFTRGRTALEPPPPAPALTKDRLAALRRAAGSPAIAAASARKEGPTRLWVDGERAVGSGIAARDSDLWHLGSISKSMTATLIGRLVDAGAVRWD